MRGSGVARLSQYLLQVWLQCQSLAVHSHLEM